MPRDANGIYTLPAGNPVTPLTPIESTWANNTLDDIATALSGSLSRSGLGPMLAPLELIAGTEITPALNFGDPDTGFFGSTGEINITISGTEAGGWIANRFTNIYEIAAQQASGTGTNYSIHSFRDFDGDLRWDFASLDDSATPANNALLLRRYNTAGVLQATAVSFDAAGAAATFESQVRATAAAPAAASDLTRKDYVDSQIALSPPVGSVLLYAGAVAPTNYALCDGTAVDRTTYATLFALIGTTFGVGDGSTTFNLPNLCGRVPVGVGTRAAMTEDVAAASVTVASNEIAVTSNTNKWITGMKVRVSSTGTLPAPLVAATDYWLVRISATAIKLSTTVANSLPVSPTVIDITTQGTGTHTITEQLDSVDTVTLAQVGGQNIHQQSVSELVSHTHTLNGGAQVNCGGGPSPAMTFSSPQAASQASGGNTAMQWMQAFLGMNYIIKLT